AASTKNATGIQRWTSPGSSGTRRDSTAPTQNSPVTASQPTTCAGSCATRSREAASRLAHPALTVTGPGGGSPNGSLARSAPPLRSSHPQCSPRSAVTGDHLTRCLRTGSPGAVGAARPVGEQPITSGKRGQLLFRPSNRFGGRSAPLVTGRVVGGAEASAAAAA